MGAESTFFLQGREKHDVYVCVCVCMFETEFDLHVVMLQLTQARLHWDKSSGLTGILKRSELSLKLPCTQKMHTPLKSGRTRPRTGPEYSQVHTERGNVAQRVK